MALGECGHTGTAGTSTALQAECCPHDPAPASDAGEEGAECSVLRGRARDAGPARPLCLLLPSPQLRPHTESLCLLTTVSSVLREMSPQASFSTAKISQKKWLMILWPQKGSCMT